MPRLGKTSFWWEVPLSWGKQCQTEHLICQLPLSSRKHASILALGWLMAPLSLIWAPSLTHPGTDNHTWPYSGWTKHLRQRNFSRALSGTLGRFPSLIPSWPPLTFITRGKNNHEKWRTLRSYVKAETIQPAQGGDATDLMDQEGLTLGLTGPLLQPPTSLALALSLDWLHSVPWQKKHCLLSVAFRLLSNAKTMNIQATKAKNRMQGPTLARLSP